MSAHSWIDSEAERLRDEIVFELSNPDLMAHYGGRQAWEGLLFDCHYRLWLRVRRRLPAEGHPEEEMEQLLIVMKQDGGLLPFHRFLMIHIPRYSRMALREARRFRRETLSAYHSSI
jgi:hypothetical protein